MNWDWMNPTVDLGQVPLTGVLTVVLAVLIFYYAMWRVRSDIRELTVRLTRLDTISTVDQKLSNALKVITAQAARLDAMERGIKETAAATAAAVAEELRKSQILHRKKRRNGYHLSKQPEVSTMFPKSHGR